jgi:hypothetical protein
LGSGDGGVEVHARDLRRGRGGGTRGHWVLRKANGAPEQQQVQEQNPPRNTQNAIPKRGPYPFAASRFTFLTTRPRSRLLQVLRILYSLPRLGGWLLLAPPRSAKWPRAPPRCRRCVWDEGGKHHAVKLPNVSGCPKKKGN